MEEFSIQIGDRIIPFFDRLVFLSSYKDRDNNTNAYGPYWALIKGYYPDSGVPTHIVIHFEGYTDDFDVFIHLDDLQQLDYKFLLPGSNIYAILEADRNDFVNDARKRGIKLSEEESYAQHNDYLYNSHIQSGHEELLNIYGLSHDIIGRLTAYDEWTNPTGPKFRGDLKLEDIVKEFSTGPKYKQVAIVGSQKQWKSVDVRGDGDCMFRAIANGLNYLYTDGKEEWGEYNKAQDKLQKKLRIEAVSWLCNPKNQNMILPGGQTVYDAMVDAARDSGWVKNRKEPLPGATPKEMKLWSKYAESAINAYCKNKLEPGHWGKDLEIFALSNLYNVAINVYHRQAGETMDESYDQFKARYTSTDESIKGEVNIYLINWNHYHVMYPNINGKKS